MPPARPEKREPGKSTGLPANKGAGFATFAVMLWALALLCNCAGRPLPDQPPSAPAPENIFSGFWASNQHYLNRIYTTAYVRCDFVVDTERGGRPIQSLMDAEAVKPLLTKLSLGNASAPIIINKSLNYVHRRFRYTPAPNQWPTVAQTLQTGKGDCKGLSLFLVTLLNAAGVDSYAAVSSGHMWAVAHNGESWQVLETDPDPGRREIYQANGIYDLPLYKIFVDRSYKRKRKGEADPRVKS